MKNPLDQFRSSLFGTRGCDIALALQYVDELASASTDAVAVQTAARVLLNTVIGAVDQILTSRSPERLALIELIDERIKASASDIDQQISDWMDNNVDHGHLISEWLSDNFDVTDYNINDAIESWMDNNMDDKLHDAVSNLNFTVVAR